jgi:hypothetical protein
MKYFIDTEFIEGFNKPILGKDRHFIDLISIGIVAEDGRSYYAISKEFNEKDASEWVNENVIKKLIYPMPIENFNYEYDSEYSMHTWFDDKKNGYVFAFPEGLYTKNTSFQKLIEYLKNLYPKSNTQIAKEIKDFIYETSTINDHESISKWEEVKHSFSIEFYGYYADYDWVLFCSLFGTMMDLPKGFPMYCRDLKQVFDDKVLEREKETIMKEGNWFDWSNHLKTLPSYPKHYNEHNAIDDARWNKDLFIFLAELK